MQRPISIPQPPWTDAQLAEAIRTSTNWRSVMLLLGFGERARSAGAIRIVRRRATELDLDSSHFRGKRRWSDDDLRQAVAECRSWEEVMARLGLSIAGRNVHPHVKSHTIRLGLDTDHLNAVNHVGRQPPEAVPLVSALRIEPKYLRVAAPVMAAAWFMLRGCAVSFPAEPTVYDLLADTPQGIMRVQVKSTTSARKDGWQVGVGHHPDTHAKKQGYLLAYSPDEIDFFFIVDGDMTVYLIPSRAIAGRVGILLRTYRKYIVGNAQGLLEVAAGAEDARMRSSA
jgi:PD-(D/E)XK endonuclease